MNSVKTPTRAVFVFAACAIALVMGAGAASAVDAPMPAHAVPTKEMREQMATLHEKMAVCLRSDKAVAVCHEEMMKACHTTMGEKECPMMGMHDHMGKDHTMGTMPPK